jgi:hypothetical protein
MVSVQEIPVLLDSPEVQEHSWAHGLRPSLRRTHSYRNLPYNKN